MQHLRATYNEDGEDTTPLLGIKWVEFRGNPVGARQLTFCELDATMPFEVKRVYWIHALSADEERGQHAHRDTQQLLIAMSGRILIRLNDGVRTHQYLLDSPTRGLWIPSGLWRDIAVLDDHSVLLSMASTHFDEADYIRDYGAFQVFAGDRRIEKLGLSKHSGDSNDSANGSKARESPIDIHRTDLIQRNPPVIIASPVAPPAVISFLDLPSIVASDRDELIQTLTRVFDSGRFVMGPELEAFEQEFAAYCGTKYAVGVGNGLDALYLSLVALGIGTGDEVIVPAHTFVATWLAITRCGAIPIAVEPDANSCLVNAQAVAKKISPCTRAVVVVHLYGSIAGINDIKALCRQHGVPLIEDAAQAHGAVSGGVRAGNFGIVGCFSFYPSKNLGAFGDGGAIVTNDLALADSVRKLRNYGSKVRYQHEVEGINSRLDDIQAAFLRVRVRRLDTENRRRQIIAQMYLARLANTAGLQLPVAGDDGSHVWHLFVVQTPLRDALQKYLLAQGCETLIHYPSPVYRFAPFVTFSPADESVADRVAARVLSLPMGPHLRDADVETVCQHIAAFFKLNGGTEFEHAQNAPP
jgi:dTDP-3-amino-3,4,6-trideoxy-alpha-D-glucose transaminase